MSQQLTNLTSESTKLCKKCKVEKLINEFSVRRKEKDGLNFWCRSCVHQYNTQYYIKKPEKIKEQNQQYRFDNPHKVKGQNKKYKENNPEKVKEINHQYYSKTIQKHKQYNKQWLIKHPFYYKQRYATDNIVRTACLCRNMVITALNGNPKSEHTMTYFMCSHKEFKAHIEKQWEPWMNWNNRGNGPGKWNVDHIIPISFFNMLDPVEVYMCCRYQNLCPLSWEDNMKKGFKVSLHF